MPDPTKRRPTPGEMGINPAISRGGDSPQGWPGPGRDVKNPDGRSSILDAQPTAFFSRTYDEAVDLVEAARSYLKVLEPIDRKTLAAPDRLRLCSETMRMTARLTQIMAWLLSQRAVHAGEITRAEALSDQQALTDVAVCMTQDEQAWRGLPQRLVNLLDKSHRLYVRVARLDELARRSVN